MNEKPTNWQKNGRAQILCFFTKKCWKLGTTNMNNCVKNMVWMSQVKENKSQSFTFHPSSLRRQLLFVSATTASMSTFFWFCFGPRSSISADLFGPNKTNRQTERKREAHMNKMSDWMREMTQNGRFALSSGSRTAPLHCRGSCCIRQLEVS